MTAENKIMADVNERSVSQIFAGVASHPFHPLNDENSMTIDKTLNKDGVADLNDTEGKQ